MVICIENTQQHTKEATRANKQVYQFHKTGQPTKLNYIFIWPQEVPGNLNMKIIPCKRAEKYEVSLKI